MLRGKSDGTHDAYIYCCRCTQRRRCTPQPATVDARPRHHEAPDPFGLGTEDQGSLRSRLMLQPWVPAAPSRGPKLHHAVAEDSHIGHQAGEVTAQLEQHELISERTGALPPSLSRPSPLASARRRSSARRSVVADGHSAQVNETVPKGVQLRSAVNADDRPWRTHPPSWGGPCPAASGGSVHPGPRSPLRSGRSARAGPWP